MGLKAVEAVGPFGVRPAEPVVHGEQALELKSRGAALAVAAPGDEAGPLEHFEVLGDGGLGQSGGLREFDYTSLAGREALEDRPAGGVGKAAKARLRGSLVTITDRLYN